MMFKKGKIFGLTMKLQELDADDWCQLTPPSSLDTVSPVNDYLAVRMGFSPEKCMGVEKPLAIREPLRSWLSLLRSRFKRPPYTELL